MLQIPNFSYKSHLKNKYTSLLICLALYETINFLGLVSCEGRKQPGKKNNKEKKLEKELGIVF